METIKGYVDHIKYTSQANGFTVLIVIVQGEEVSCVGRIQKVEQGDNLELTGEYKSHAVYGEQFEISSVKIVPPDDVTSMERYLACGAIKGIGATLASRIVKRFGEDTFRIMEEEPERLSEIKGISDRIAREIGRQMEEKKDLRQAMVFLQQYGISGNLSVKIWSRYGMDLYKVLQENPYKLAEDISGVGFKLADEIALKAGIRIDSDYRIRSGILYTLLLASLDGHMYLPKDILLDRAGKSLGLETNQMETQLENLMMEQKIVIKLLGDRKIVYAASFYYVEMSCARMLEDLNRAIDYTEKTYQLSKIRRIEQELEIELDELQRKAVAESVCHGVFLLSGGPGTGKTTTINTIIRYYMEEGYDILLAAPTGRAAKRMTEATGYEARTIHRMLEINGAVEDKEDGRGAKFERNESNPLEADVIIVDEMSMVDIFLFQALLKAITPGTRLIMVGDMDQLPSVGPGQVLHDLICSKQFSQVILQKIFRQAGESDIVINAHKINQGEQISLDNKSKDFFFLERNDTAVIYKHMVQLIRDKLPGYVHAKPQEIQVLTPMKKGPLGVETLNPILQQYLNPPSPDKKEYMQGERSLFREGDKVMQIKNNYQLEWEILSKYQIPIDKGMGVFNGDIGTVVSIQEYSEILEVEFDDHRRVKYPFSGVDELELAYAITIHKSQGSEYPAVIMPILSGPRLLFNRNLLYTAVTRAKGCVTILGSPKTIQEMIDNQNENKRYTSLDERIQEVALATP